MRTGGRPILQHKFGGTTPPPGGGGGGGVGPTLPTGVDTQQIDGGSTFYATNLLTKATAWPTSVTYGSGTVTYTGGWDDPQFFPISLWSPDTSGRSTSTARWLSLGLNTLTSVGAPTAFTLDDMNAANISVVWPYFYGGQLTSVNRAPGAECVGILTFDEPNLFANYETATTIPLTGQGTVTLPDNTYSGGIITVAGTVTGGTIMLAYNESYGQPTWTGTGIPAGSWVTQPGGSGGSGGPGQYAVNTAWSGGGSPFSHVAATQAAVSALPNSIIGGRFIAVNYAAANGLRFNAISSFLLGTQTIAAHLASTYLCQDSRTRHIEATGHDFYMSVIAWYNAGSITNIYDTSGGTAAWSYSTAAKGSRYGDTIDFMRRIWTTTNSIPLSITIDNCNALAGSPYDTQPCEFHWAIWSSIIHGARGIIYFNQVDGTSYSGCSGAGIGNEVTNCTFMQSAQSCTFTGTISGSTLTVASNPSSGTLSRGMRATSGVTGTAIILQQTNNLTTPGKGTNTTYTIAGSAGAQGPVTMTFKQSQVGFGISAVSMGGINAVGADCGMTPGMKVINDTIRAMAPVINSPFAVAATGGSGKCYVDVSTVGLSYSFPSDTVTGLGVKNTTPPQSIAFGLASGIECCTHYYTGSSYNYGSDTIKPAFYIFATTRQTADTIGTSVTFKLNDPLATSVTAIGEGRANIAVSGGQFTDTFDYAWTVHIYRVNY